MELGSCRRLLRRVIENRVVQEFASRPMHLPQVGEVDRFMCLRQSSLVTEAQLGMVTEDASLQDEAIFV